MDNEMARLTQRFEDALIFSFQLHSEQRRKANNVPYISHLLSVAALVLENGGDEDEAIAALLHDAVEDQGGLSVLYAIKEKFGSKVANIVDGCSDTTESPKPAWRLRKESYLKRLRLQPPDVRRVALADKLHNARSLLLVLRSGDHTVWDRFNGGKEGTLWYFQALLDIFRETGEDVMTEELGVVIAYIIELS